MTAPDSFKAEIRRFWETHPCGSHLSAAPPGSSEFFQDLDRFRYAEDRWIPRWIAHQDLHNKTLLEIGCGLGGDLARLTAAGSRITAVDMTRAALLFTRRRFQLLGLSGAFIQADMQQLPFPAASFDVVFSLGVLHHTPRIECTVEEIFRILRPGGKVLVVLYHKHSFHYFWNILFLNGVVKGKLLRKDLRTVIAEGTDGYGNPWSTLYTKKQARRLFANFERVSVRVRGLTIRSVWNKLGKYFHPENFPHWMKSLLDFGGSRVGWYVLVEAFKPPSKEVRQREKLGG